MSEEDASAFVERRAFEAALAETEMHRAANAALQSQLGQAHEATLLAQADAETLGRIVEVAQSIRIAVREVETAQTGGQDVHARYVANTHWRALRTMLEQAELARSAHPGTPLADEVRAARTERWACQSCGAEFPHIPGDADVSRCTKCVEVEVAGQQLEKALADYAMLRAVARMCFTEDASEDSMLRLWNIAAMVDHPGAPLVIRYNRAAAVVEAARAWRTARETLNGIADAEATLLAAVAATDESLKAERGNE